mmetsp:Transcript_24090/g.27499  ORF Transcript_24090/g.27499 Transcript_24090/m.27499 type:complete len:431 (-) Transcript_24090:138-1430(-)
MSMTMTHLKSSCTRKSTYRYIVVIAGVLVVSSIFYNLSVLSMLKKYGGYDNMQVVKQQMNNTLVDTNTNPAAAPSSIENDTTAAPVNVTSTSTNNESFQQGGDINIAPSSASSSKTTSSSTNVTSFGSIERLLLNNATNFADISVQLLGLANFSTPKDFHLVMVGDSLTRFQYLSFIYFLKYKKWLDPTTDLSTHERVAVHKDTSWQDFFKNTKEIMAPEEECDCFRPGTHHRIVKSEYDKLIENRYYHDKDSNISVTYLQKFGPDNSFKSTWNVTDVHNPHTLVTGEQSQNMYIYKTKNWTEHIHDFVSKLEPKPKYFVFNEGTWVGWERLSEDNHYYSVPEVRMKIINAISYNGMVSVYKTTSNWKSYTGPPKNYEYEKHFCELADFCLDLSWTKKIPNETYWDNIHYIEPIYRFINLQMMELLSLVD